MSLLPLKITFANAHAKSLFHHINLTKLQECFYVAQLYDNFHNNGTY